MAQKRSAASAHRAWPRRLLQPGGGVIVVLELLRLERAGLALNEFDAGFQFEPSVARAVGAELIAEADKLQSPPKPSAH